MWGRACERRHRNADSARIKYEADAQEPKQVRRAAAALATAIEFESIQARVYDLHSISLAPLWRVDAFQKIITMDYGKRAGHCPARGRL